VILPVGFNRTFCSYLRKKRRKKISQSFERVNTT
jgi:hypothetical protein